MYRLAPQLSVLVASDDDWSARALESILNAEGYVVRRARSALDALAMARGGAVDAVIAESALPDRGAVELCRMLRAEVALPPRIPVVITVRGPVERDARIRAHEAGVWQVFGEPLDVPLLVRQLDAYLGHQPSAAHAPILDVLAARNRPFAQPAPFGRRAGEMGSDGARRRVPLAAVALGASIVSTRAAVSAGPCAAVPGDDVLAALAARLDTWLRSSDVMVHLGAGDIGILAPGAGARAARNLVRRLAHAVRGASWPIGPRQKLVLRAGISAVSDFTGGRADADRLLEEAAAALRRSTPTPEQTVQVCVR